MEQTEKKIISRYEYNDNGKSYTVIASSNPNSKQSIKDFVTELLKAQIYKKDSQ